MGDFEAILPVLQEWSTVRKRLSSAIKSYVITSTTLSDLCSRVRRPPVQLEEFLVILGSQLDALYSEEQALNKTRMCLTALRNRSVTLSPMNKLPPEVLSNIFSLSKDSCELERSIDINRRSFLCVSTYWRQVAMNTASLWTHVDIRPSNNECWSSHPLEWTRDSLIHVHICEPERFAQETRVATSEEAIRATITMLTPHIDRINSLDIDSFSRSSNFITAILTLWFDRTDASSAKSFSISRSGYCEIIHYDASSAEFNTVTPNMERTLCSLETLRLDNVTFSWNSGAFSGLVDLRLSYYEQNVVITTSQMYTILRSNPALVRLRVEWLDIECPLGWTDPPPVTFKHLKMLNLIYLPPRHARLLLPLIAVPSGYSDLSAGLSVNSDMYSVVADFIRRVPTTTLCISGYDMFSAWPLFLALEVCPPSLALHDLYLKTAGDTPSPDSSQSVDSVHIPRVTLYECIVTFEALEIFVTKHQVRYLCLASCRPAILSSIKDVNILCSLLMEKNPELHCEVSGTSAVDGLPQFELIDSI